jgi:hypothetical protein
MAKPYLRGFLFLILFALASSRSTGAEVFPSSEPVLRRIAVAPAGDEKVAGLARELAAKLKACSGLDFEVALGAKFEGKGILLEVDPKAAADLGPEGVILEGTPAGLAIRANSAEGLQDGVSLYLEKLGFRWLLPDPAWHVVPKTAHLFGALSLRARPSWEARRIFYAYGTRSKVLDAGIAEWNRWNRMGGIEVRCGHSWPAIVNRNKEEFARHPEYWAADEDGSRPVPKGSEGGKFCCSNEGLVQLCIADALRQFDADPSPLMVSMDPSDGSRTCACPACKKLGSPSDQVFWLANRVAKAVREQRPGKWVGLYAYASHLMPTEVKLEPNVYVAVATAFNSTPLSLDELIAQWGRRAGMLGIREYYGVMAWDFDMPGRPRGANVAYVRRSIPHFYALGARTMVSESNCGFISRGVGHYLAARLFWDAKADPDAVVNDFFEKAFGPAAAPMRKLHDAWQATAYQVPTGNDMAVWLRMLAEADPLATDPAVRARIAQVKAYMHYVALYRDWQDLEGTDKELPAYTELLRFAWRLRDTGACASYALARRIANSRAPSPEYKVGNPKAVWMDDPSPVSAAEAEKLFAADRGRYREIAGLRAVGRSRRFETAPAATGDKAAPVSARLRGRHCLVVEVPAKGPASLRLTMGLVKSHGRLGWVRAFPLDAEVDVEEDPPKLSADVPSDGQPHDVDLAPLGPGAWAVYVEDHRSGWNLETSPGLRFNLVADAVDRMWTVGRHAFVFMVPKGTQRFAIIREGPLALAAPGEKPESWEDRKDALIEVDAKGREGLWRISSQTHRFHLVGVPPHVGLSEATYLAPIPEPKP